MQFTLTQEAYDSIRRALWLAKANDESRLYALPASDDYRVSLQKDTLSASIGTYKSAMKYLEESCNSH
jgi:hypothetical protein